MIQSLVLGFIIGLMIFSVSCAPKQGIQGGQGVQGPSGQSVVGPQGDPGLNGTDGTSPQLPKYKCWWNNGVYNQGDTVVFKHGSSKNGHALYQAKESTEGDPDTNPYDQPKLWQVLPNKIDPNLVDYSPCNI